VPAEPVEEPDDPEEDAVDDAAGVLVLLLEVELVDDVVEVDFPPDRESVR